jgi:hypothetical protein
VAKDLPENSTIVFDFLLPIGIMEEMGYDLNSYEGTTYRTFVLLFEKADVKALNAKIPGFLNSLHTSELSPVQFLTPVKKDAPYGEERAYIGLYEYHRCHYDPFTAHIMPLQHARSAGQRKWGSEK